MLKVPFFQKFDEAQKNMSNHYLKLEFLKLHFVCLCFEADFQANPTDISSKKKRENSNNEFKIVKRHICLSL